MLRRESNGKWVPLLTTGLQRGRLKDKASNTLNTHVYNCSLDFPLAAWTSALPVPLHRPDAPTDATAPPLSALVRRACSNRGWRNYASWLAHKCCPTHGQFGLEVPAHAIARHVDRGRGCTS